MLSLFQEQPGPFLAWLAHTFIVFLRYFIPAAIAYWIFYKKGWFGLGRKIQRTLPKDSRIRDELQESAISAMLFGLIILGLSYARKAGYTALYFDLDAYGYWYLPFSFFLIILLHDAYFFWMHRWMHHSPKLLRIHAVHHRSYNPTPFTALAFHPIEALLEIAVIPIMALVLPLHPLVLLAYGLFSITWNILGHLGYELFPSGWVNGPITKYINSSTYHNMHHADGRHNFALYFNYWDRWSGSFSPRYNETFQRVTLGQVKAAK